MTTLLLRLAGPMQSWGTQSRFKIRDTGLEPSKSGVIGLLCAALGKPREEKPEDEGRFPSLAELASLRMGIRVDREGKVARDYHTAGGCHRQGEEYGVPTSDNTGKRTVTSERYYLTDADFLVGLEGTDGRLLARLWDKLDSPTWAVYLGRKSFVPACPVRIEDGLMNLSVEEALGTYPWFVRTRSEYREALRRIDAGEGRLRTVIQVPFGSTSEVRHDVPLSFSERRFTIRYVRTDWVPLGRDMVREGLTCTSHA